MRTAVKVALIALFVLMMSGVGSAEAVAKYSYEPPVIQLPYTPLNYTTFDGQSVDNATLIYNGDPANITYTYAPREGGYALNITRTSTTNYTYFRYDLNANTVELWAKAGSFTYAPSILFYNTSLGSYVGGVYLEFKSKKDTEAGSKYFEKIYPYPTSLGDYSGYLEFNYQHYNWTHIIASYDENNSTLTLAIDDEIIQLPQAGGGSVDRVVVAFFMGSSFNPTTIYVDDIKLYKERFTVEQLKGYLPFKADLAFTPLNKDFSITFSSDADEMTYSNMKPIFEFLDENGFKYAITAWVKSNYTKADNITSPEYRTLLLQEKNKGNEIGLHTPSDSDVIRSEMIDLWNTFVNLMGFEPENWVDHGNVAQDLVNDATNSSSDYYFWDYIQKTKWWWVNDYWAYGGVYKYSVASNDFNILHYDFIYDWTHPVTGVVVHDAVARIQDTQNYIKANLVDRLNETVDERGLYFGYDHFVTWSAVRYNGLNYTHNLYTSTSGYNGQTWYSYYDTFGKNERACEDGGIFMVDPNIKDWLLEVAKYDFYSDTPSKMIDRYRIYKQISITNDENTITIVNNADKTFTDATLIINKPYLLKDENGNIYQPTKNNSKHWFVYIGDITPGTHVLTVLNESFKPVNAENWINGLWLDSGGNIHVLSGGRKNTQVITIPEPINKVFLGVKQKLEPGKITLFLPPTVKTGQIPMQVKPTTTANITVHEYSPSKVSFTADAPEKESVKFTLSGLEPGHKYEVLVDGNKAYTLMAGADGTIVFTWNKWSDHSFEVKDVGTPPSEWYPPPWAPIPVATPGIAVDYSALVWALVVAILILAAIAWKRL